MFVFRTIYEFFVDTIQTLILAGAVFLVVYIFLFRPFQVSGESMYPTFQNKEYVLTNLIALRFGDPKRGDVIVFKAPTDLNKDFIKRVIGVPGDTVVIKDGMVYINNKKLDESAYLNSQVKTYGQTSIHENEKLTVPQGWFLVMGDNRPYSSDSREWGLLKRENIIGKSLVVYWPFTRARIVHNPEE